MKYLITGGCGFIGFHLAKKLINQGDEVVIIDNFNNYYDPEIKRNRAAILEGALIYENDILDNAALEKIFSAHSFDKVIHLAAQPGVRLSASQPELYIKNNIEGTFNIFEICRKHKIKNIVFASSSSVYFGSTLPFSENQTLSPEMSIYAYTKRANEMLAEIYCMSYGMNIVALRFFSAYGTHGRPDLIFNIVPDSIVNNKVIMMYGDGEQKRDFTHINDIVRSIILAAELKRGYEVFNIGNGQPVSMNKLIEIMSNEIKSDAKIEYRDKIEVDMNVTHADISKAKEVLKWEPEVSIEDGFSELAKWHLEKRK